MNFFLNLFQNNNNTNNLKKDYYLTGSDIAKKTQNEKKQKQYYSSFNRILLFLCYLFLMFSFFKSVLSTPTSIHENPMIFKTKNCYDQVKPFYFIDYFEPYFAQINEFLFHTCKVTLKCSSDSAVEDLFFVCPT